MGMARLFFHAPRFGVLDECTNATSVDVEEALFEHAAKLDITLVTITQRTALVSVSILLKVSHPAWCQRQTCSARLCCNHCEPGCTPCMRCPYEWHDAHSWRHCRFGSTSMSCGWLMVRAAGHCGACHSHEPPMLCNVEGLRAGQQVSSAFIEG